MKSRFRLGVVLRLREMAEEKARLHLGEALGVHRAAVLELERLSVAVDAERTRLATLQRSSGVTAGDYVAADEAIHHAERDQARGRVAVDAATEALLEARLALGEARQRLEVVERLRDRIAAAERLEAERKEIAILGDLATTRHAWRSMEESAR